MATIDAPSSVRTYILEHMLESLERTPAQDEPFSHFYIENVFPEDIYARMMEEWPSPDRYKPLDAGQYHNEQGVGTAGCLFPRRASIWPACRSQRELWDGIAMALAAPELKSLVFRKLATDYRPVSACRRAKSRTSPRTASRRYSAISTATRSPRIPTAGQKSSRCSFTCRATAANWNSARLLYRRRFHSLTGVYSWQGRFEKVKQFIFAPNTGYAFAVSNSWNKKSWHGREELPGGCGVRNTLLNIYFRR